MFTLYIDDAGTDVNKRFDVIRMLTIEYGMPLGDAKLLLVGVRVKLKSGKVSELQAIQVRLEFLGASGVIECCTTESDDA